MSVHREPQPVCWINSLKFKSGSAYSGFGWAKFWLRITAPASDRSPRFCTSSRVDVAKTVLQNLMKVWESASSGSTVRLKSYRGGRAPVGAKFCLCDTGAQNFIFRAVESAFKFGFWARMGQTARMLRRAKFRLPRRINFRSPARLNLKCALLWRKFKTRFDDQI